MKITDSQTMPKIWLKAENCSPMPGRLISISRARAIRHVACFPSFPCSRTSERSFAAQEHLVQLSLSKNNEDDLPKVMRLHFRKTSLLGFSREIQPIGYTHTCIYLYIYLDIFKFIYGIGSFDYGGSEVPQSVICNLETQGS